MSNVPPGLRYTESHEWIRSHEDGTITVGITDFAQKQLGDIVYVELPDVGAEVQAGEPMGVVESVKVASDIYAPVAGAVVASNGELETGPERVNEDSYQAWFVSIRPTDPPPLEGFMDAAGYVASIPADE